MENEQVLFRDLRAGEVMWVAYEALWEGAAAHRSAHSTVGQVGVATARDVVLPRVSFCRFVSHSL